MEAAVCFKYVFLKFLCNLYYLLSVRIKHHMMDIWLNKKIIYYSLNQPYIYTYSKSLHSEHIIVLWKIHRMWNVTWNSTKKLYNHYSHFLARITLWEKHYAKTCYTCTIKFGKEFCKQLFTHNHSKINLWRNKTYGKCEKNSCLLF